MNPKDFILFGKKGFNVVKTWKDNTGEQKYVEDMAFPTLNFPSDHGILATVIEFVSPDQNFTLNKISGEIDGNSIQ